MGVAELYSLGGERQADQFFEFFELISRSIPDWLGDMSDSWLGELIRAATPGSETKIGPVSETTVMLSCGAELSTDLKYLDRQSLQVLFFPAFQFAINLEAEPIRVDVVEMKLSNSAASFSESKAHTVPSQGGLVWDGRRFGVRYRAQGALLFRGVGPINGLYEYVYCLEKQQCLGTSIADMTAARSAVYSRAKAAMGYRLDRHIESDLLNSPYAELRSAALEAAWTVDLQHAAQLASRLKYDPDLQVRQAAQFVLEQEMKRRN